MGAFQTVISSLRPRDAVCLFAISAVMATCGVFGVSYVLGEGWPTLSLWAEVVLSLIFTLVFALLLFLIDVAFTRYKMMPEKEQSIFNLLTPQWWVPSIALFALIMALFWLPWYVVNYPGGTYWDTYYQIYQMYPENHPISIIPWEEIARQTYTDAWIVDHHPFVTTLLYGWFGMTSDTLTGNWMLGVAVFCALQGIAHVVVFTAAVAYMRRIGCPPLLNFIAYAFFALMPFVSTWAMCMVKDSLFGVFYVPYFILLIEIVRTRGEVMLRPRNRVLFVLLALILCLTKKQGIFVIVAVSVVGLIAFRKGWKAGDCKGEGGKGGLGAPGRQANPLRKVNEVLLSQALLSCIVMLVLLPLIIFPLANIAPGGKQEVLGPLFQQTARYIVDHEDEVTPEERQAVDAVLDYKRLYDQYTFDFQDSVKYRYNVNSTNEDLIRYLKVYVAQGLKHPDSYFGAIMSLAGFYVAPTSYLNIRMVTVDTKMGPDQRYMLWNPDELDAYRLGFDEAYKAIGWIPVLDLPLLTVTYVFWLPAVLMYIAFRYRLRKTSLIFTPQLVLLAFCIIAPVFDARYAIPIFDVAPLFFCGIAVLLKSQKSGSSTMGEIETKGSELPEEAGEGGPKSPADPASEASSKLVKPVSLEEKCLQKQPAQGRTKVQSNIQS